MMFLAQGIIAARSTSPEKNRPRLGPRAADTTTADATE